MASAMGIKLTSSIDDVVWLAPFLTCNLNRAARVTNAGIYTGVCMVQTVLAMAIASSGDWVVKWITKGKAGAWSTDKILTVGAGSLLGLFAAKLIFEYVTESGDEENAGPDAEKGDALKDGPKYDKVETAEPELASPLATTAEKGAPSKVETAEPALASPLATTAEEGAPSKAPENSLEMTEDPGRTERATPGLSSGTLFVIAFIGSIDDLTLFVPMLVGRGFDPLQLMLGAFLAASAIVLLCLFAGLCKPVADCLSNIPLFAIVGTFAGVLLVKGFLIPVNP